MYTYNVCTAINENDYLQRRFNQVLRGLGQIYVIKYNKKRTSEIDEWWERNEGYFILDLLVTVVKGS